MVCLYDDMNYLDDKLLPLILRPQLLFEFTKLPYHENHYYLHCNLVLFLFVFMQCISGAFGTDHWDST